jgi:hypothetical protein
VNVSPFRIPRKQWGGFESIAEQAIGAGPQARTLVASDARGEGMFIADMAERDAHRPSYTVERASKILASSTWSGSGYQSLYQTPEQVREALAKGGITLVVTDASLPVLPAHDLLLITTTRGAGFPILGASTAVRDAVESAGAIELHNVPMAAGNP